jgi:gas vesicle protein
MQPHNDEHRPNERSGSGASGLVAGVLLGSLVGAGSMVLLAPRSGKKTRAKLQRATITLRDETANKAGQLTAGLRAKAGELQQRGQNMLVQQKERWSPVIEAGQKAVQGTPKD